MPDITLRHEIDTDEDTYWNHCVFDDDYNKRLFLQILHFPAYSVLEHKDSGATIARRVQVEPPVGGVPGPVKKVIGDRLSYVEEGTFDRAKKRYTFKVVPSTLPDKTKINGEMWCEKLGDKKIARMVKMSVEVKVFMVGSMVEEMIMKDLRASYDKGASFTNEFVKEKGL